MLNIQNCIVSSRENHIWHANETSLCSEELQNFCPMNESFGQGTDQESVWINIHQWFSTWTLAISRDIFDCQNWKMGDLALEARCAAKHPSVPSKQSHSTPSHPQATPGKNSLAQISLVPKLRNLGIHLWYYQKMSVFTVFVSTSVVAWSSLKELSIFGGIPYYSKYYSYKKIKVVKTEVSFRGKNIVFLLPNTLIFSHDQYNYYYTYSYLCSNNLSTFMMA